MERIEREYELKDGVLIRDMRTFDYSKNMTNANLTEELALFHLCTNPACRGKFKRLPEDIDKRIKAASKIVGVTTEQTPKTHILQAVLNKIEGIKAKINGVIKKQ